jgi:hypothetical protein
MKATVPQALPEIEPSPDGGFRVTFFLGEPTNNTTPYREFLGRFVEALATAGEQAQVDLPPYAEDEDFISGSLTWNRESYAVYFEHSVGYLEIRASSRESLGKLVSFAPPEKA